MQNDKIRAEHSIAGAMVVNNLGETDKSRQALYRILAYIIAGHHAGLPDWDSADDTCLSIRLDKKIPDYTAWANEIKLPDDVILPSFKWLPKDSKLISFQISLLIRMLFSCLVDADYLDTESFMNPLRSTLRKHKYPSLKDLKDKLDKALLNKTEEADKTEINEQRSAILKQCRLKSSLPQGLFTLTVPTGGGKTLSSLSFAFDHALHHDLDRIIYVIPYTSIIEQNAKVFRDILGDEAVVEHHSNYEISTDLNTENIDESYRRLIMATETWDAPLIVTTNVQFFESLFANCGSRCRKLHNLCRSVIILDEAQLMNTEFLIPSLKALEELVRNYQVSILLCTATQPSLGTIYSPDIKPTEIMDNPISLYQSFKRVTVQSPSTEVLPDEQLVKELAELNQVLCIVNTRRHAADIYANLEGIPLQGNYHLSARMYPKHRSETIRKIKSDLSASKICRVISTQIVEAGVDLDFPVVYRALAGLDSIAQAAGRCNREGHNFKGMVRVFRPERGQPKGWFSRVVEISDIIIRNHPQDILELSAIQDYFKYLYANPNELDRKEIYKKYPDLEVPFKTIAESFQWIENNTCSLIIPGDDECLNILQQLEKYPEQPVPYRKLQKYTIQIYPYELIDYKKKQVIDVLNERYYFIRPEAMKDCYDSSYGLKFNIKNSIDPENYIM